MNNMFTYDQYTHWKKEVNAKIVFAELHTSYVVYLNEINLHSLSSFIKWFIFIQIDNAKMRTPS